MDNVIITGATSMLGGALLNSLLRHGVERVYAVVQPGSKRLDRLPSDDRIVCVACDCEAYHELPELIHEPCEAFYHFAWIPAKGRVDVAYRDVGQTLNALNSAHALGAKVFVGAGSQSEYGNRREEIQSPEDPSDPLTAYAAAKDACRRLCILKGGELGIPVRWVRIFSIYGPHDRSDTMISSTLPKLLRNETVELTACEQHWEFLYEDDAGEAFYYVGSCTDRGSNIYCLGSGDSKPLREFVEEMRSITQSRSDIRYGAVPYSAQTVMNLHADITKIKETGWPGPKISFHDGISAMANQLQRDG